MRFSQQLVLGIAMASLVFAAGCKNKGAVDTGVAQAVNEDKWVIADVNGLLPYVPENTPMVLASTRQLDMDNLALKNIYSMLSKSIVNSLKNIETKFEAKKQARPNAKGVAEYEGVMQIYTVLKPLLENEGQGALLWGLDEKAHVDFIAYVDGVNPVAKISLKDNVKFETKILELIAVTKKVLPAKYALPDMTERKVEDETFRIISLKPYVDNTHGVCVLCDDAHKSYLPSNLVIHIGKKTATFALLEDSFDDAALKRIVSPAAAPLKKEAFGKIDADMLLTGYVNNQAAYRSLLQPQFKPFLTDIIGSELTAACETEITALINKFPKLAMSTQVSVENGASNNLVLHMTDKEMLKKIQALHVNAVDIKTASPIVSASLNIDLDGTIALLNETRAAMLEKPYECGVLKELPDTIKDVTRTVSDPQMKMFISGMTGISVILDKLDLKAEPKAVEALVALSGTKFGMTVPMALTMASALSPEIRDMVALQKGTPKEIDLSNLMNQPFKLNAIYHDTALVVGTSNYDVKMLADKPQSKSNHFFYLQLDDNATRVTDVTEDVILPDASQIITLGTNDDGLIFTHRMK